MGAAIGEILGNAVGVAISPVPIIAVILMLFTAKATGNSLSFLAGWVIGLSVAGAIVLALGLESSEGEESSAGGWIKIVIGLVFLGLACFVLPAAFTQAQQTSYFDEEAKSAFFDSTPQAERPYLVNLGSRLINPGQNARVDFSRGRAEVYAQFHEPLSMERRNEYVRAGARFIVADPFRETPNLEG